MHPCLSLLRIEFRRSIGLLFFPVLVAVGSWWAWQHLPVEVALWNASANAARQTVFFLGPLMAGISTWMAGRNRWRQTDELLATTPLLPATRDLTTWAGTALWGIVAYVMLAVALLAVTYPRATW